MYKIWTFDCIGKKHDIFRNENCMKRFWESFRQYVMKIINFEQKKMIPLKDKKYASYLNQINCHISKKKRNINTLMIQLVVNWKSIAIVRVNTEVLHILYVIWNILYLTTSLCFLTKDPITIIILSKKSWQKIYVKIFSLVFSVFIIS